MGFITAPFMWLFWEIAIKGPLWLISGIFQAVQFISGSIYLQLIFGIDQKWNWNGFPPAFYAMIIIGAIVLIIGLIVSIGFAMTKDGQALGSAIKNSFLHILYFGPLIFLVPALIFIFGTLLQGINTALPQVFGNGSYNIADSLYYVGNTNGQTIMNSIPPSGYDTPADIWNWNVLVTAIAVLGVGVLLIIASITLVGKSIEIFFLFIFSPVIIGASILDHGKRLMVLKEMLISKMLVILVTVFGFFLYGIVIPAVINITNNWLQDPTGAAAAVMQILVAIGGAVAVMAVGPMTAAFVGEAAGIRETWGNLGSTIKSGIGLIAGTKLAYRFGKVAMAKTYRGSKKVGGYGLNMASRLTAPAGFHEADGPNFQASFLGRLGYEKEHLTNTIKNFAKKRKLEKSFNKGDRSYAKDLSKRSGMDYYEILRKQEQERNATARDEAARLKSGLSHEEWAIKKHKEKQQGDKK